jgi:hypothetical protein
VFQLLFLLIYDVFLKNETFFNWNRFYVLASAFLSIVLPFIKIDSFKAVIPREYMYVLPEVVIGNPINNTGTEAIILKNLTTNSALFNWNYVLFLGCAIALLLFTIKLFKLTAMAYKNPKTKFEKAFLVELKNSKHAFSFFNYIFLGSDVKIEDRQSILTHELQHVKEKHSLDLLFFEVLKILFWFNPLIYMYQKRIANLHEFIADSKAVKSSNKRSYYQNLLSQIFDTEKVSFINPFFKQSLIKKRIIMLSKSKSNQINLAKYLLVFPMVIGMLFYTSCEAYQNNELLSSSDLEKYTYTINLNSENTDKTIAKQKAVSDFLFNNKAYVSWIVVDYKKEQSTITVHHESETPPSDYEDLTTDLTDGRKYKAYRKVVNKEAIINKKNNDEIAFNTIDKVPAYPGCDTSASNNDQKECFSKNLNQFVAKNFNLDLAKKSGLVGVQKMFAKFIINKEGNIENIKVRAPHPSLENEVRRVINLIPKLQPGIQDGKSVKVSFTLPIAFNVAE